MSSPQGGARTAIHRAVVRFAGPGGSGKTTLLCRLLPVLVGRGLRVGVIKQARDDFDVDRPGTDSDRLRRAGVEDLVLASPARTARVMEHHRPRAPCLESLLTLLEPDGLDIVLVEGFAGARLPAVALSRESAGQPLPPMDPWIIAVACDAPEHTPGAVPALDIDDPEAVADFLQSHLARRGSLPGTQERSP